MIVVNLYKPHTVNLSIEFPTHWNECSLPELKTIASAIFLNKYTQPQLLIALIRTRIQKAYSGMKVRLIDEAITLLSIEDLAMNFHSLISFISDKVELTAQPIPVISNIHGPSSDFTDITCGEFEDADLFFNRWLGDKQVNHLSDLTGILWRPQVNALRVTYEKYHPSFDSFKAIEILNPETLHVILLWYMGCKAMLPILFPLVYNTGNNVSDNSASVADPMAITKIIHHGAGPKNGTREDIRRMRLHEFLFDLNLEAEKETIGNA